MKIRAVFFDVGGTLIEPWPSVGEVYARVGKNFGYVATAEAMERAFRSAWKEAKAAEPTRLTTADKNWWRGLVFRALAIQGFDGGEKTRQAYFEGLYDAFVQPSAWRVYPDVVETLDAVRQRGLHVGIISNWDARLRPLLEGLKLSKHFDSITVSCEVGAEKPDEAIFHTALRAGGVAAREAIHVGDSDSEDRVGAEQLGMRALVVRQRKGNCDADLKALLPLLD